MGVGCGCVVPSAGLVRSQGLAVSRCGSGLICACVLARLGGCAGPGVWVAASMESCARGGCGVVRVGRPLAGGLTGSPQSEPSLKGLMKPPATISVLHFGPGS